MSGKLGIAQSLGDNQILISLFQLPVDAGHERP